MLKFTVEEIRLVHSAKEYLKKVYARMGMSCVAPRPPEEHMERVRSILGAGLTKKIERANGGTIGTKSLSACVRKHPVCVVCKRRLILRGKFECEACKGSLSKQEKTELVKQRRAATCMERYGRSNLFSGKEGAELVKERTLLKYGVENVMHDKTVRANYDKSVWYNQGENKKRSVVDRMKKTMVDRYGVGHWSQSRVLVRKFHKNMKSKFGVTNVMKVPEYKKRHEDAMASIDWKEVYESVKETCLERFGVENVFEDTEWMESARLSKTGCVGPWSPEAKKRYKEKTGYNHPLRNPEILNDVQSKTKRSRLTRLRYDYDTHKVIGNRKSVLGYEPYVIQDLSDHPSISRIFVGSRVKLAIPYTHTDGERRTYFPDLACKTMDGRQFAVEVKSTYTLTGIQPGSMHVNLRKFAAAYRVTGGRFVLAVVSRGTIFYIKKPHLFLKGLVQTSNTCLDVETLSKAAFYKRTVSPSVISKA
jgi:hypothetical protein